MLKRWNTATANPDAMESLRSSLNIHPVLCQLLINRGITDFDQARDFFRPRLEQLHDPFLMPDMEKAATRVMQAIESGESILVYGDYDVDGTTSVAMMYSFLSTHTNRLHYYLPDRYKEGYGISKQGMEYAAEKGCKLVIALDCGIRAHDSIAHANSLGMDVIVCDHHLPGEQLPPAFAILDPKRSDSKYPYNELSGCGVGFKLAEALTQMNDWPYETLWELLDLCCISIASDIVPITGENRILAWYGLQRLQEKPRPSVRAMLEGAGFSGKLTISDLVFIIGPRINAAGRIEHAGDAVSLLLSKDLAEIGTLAQRLDTHNRKRRELDKDITGEALERIADDSDFAARKSTVVYDPAWHKGVVGIVASRLLERHYRPTIVLCESGGKITGSARSVLDFDIHEAISGCSHLLDSFGGHKYAAGLTLSKDKLDAFVRQFEDCVCNSISEEMLVPRIEVDAELELADISASLYNIISQMGPFGPGNMRPVFCSRGIELEGPARVLKDAHLKLRVKQSGSISYDVIAFGMADKLQIVESGSFELCYTIEENHWKGRTTLQLNAKDIRSSQ